MYTCDCKKCGHNWISFRPKPPRACAACKCINWDKPRYRENYFINEAAKVGETLIFLPWVIAPDGTTDSEAMTRQNNSVRHKLNRLGIKHYAEVTPGAGGVRYWRRA